jgi:glycosyltransferase involved in cell wall biosynthesis
MERPEYLTEPASARAGVQTMASPMVSVVIPMRNEEMHIGPCLDSLLAQTYPADCYEIIVIDGRSSDRSLQVAQHYQREHRNIQLLDNPAGIVPTAMNRGITAARGEFIIRADAHSTYPPHYIETCIRTLLQTGADNVGGPVVTMPAGNALGSRLVAAVLSSRFGVGNSRFRTEMKAGYVDTVPFGAFRRELFTRIGLFDEAYGRNEDNEFNARIRRAGGKIYLAPELALNYFPAGSFFRLLRNTYKGSEWHIYTLARSRGALGARHLIPACFLLVLLALLALAFTNHAALQVLAAVLVVYGAASLYFSWRKSPELPLSVRMPLPFAFLSFHLTYGLATLAGIRFLLRKPAAKPTR